ncbi:MAG: DEAD/DEAH box helicase, partial [Paracoccaceae bacterium]
MTDASAVLRDVFGFDDFRPGQKDIVDAVTQGENVLAIMPTGGGKSLCYQLP